MTGTARVLEALGCVFAAAAWAMLGAIVVVSLGMCSGCGSTQVVKPALVTACGVARVACQVVETACDVVDGATAGGEAATVEPVE